MKTFNSLENKTASDTYWRVQLVSKKVQAHSSLEPPLEYKQDQMPLTNQCSLWETIHEIPFIKPILVTLTGSSSVVTNDTLRPQKSTPPEIAAGTHFHDTFSLWGYTKINLVFLNADEEAIWLLNLMSLLSDIPV